MTPSFIVSGGGVALCIGVSFYSGNTNHCVSEIKQYRLEQHFSFVMTDALVVVVRFISNLNMTDKWRSQHWALR
jgi:hypothetical protein